MLWRRLLPLSLALLASPAAAPVSEAQTGAAAGSWMEYAARVGDQLQLRFANTEDAAAVAVHLFFDARTAVPDATPPAPVPRLWFDRSGTVSRLEFASLGNEQIDQDLRQVVENRPFGAPPADMRQPLVLRLRLTSTL